MKKIKLLSFLLGMFIITAFLTACGKEKEAPFMTSDKKILEYSKDDLPEERFYVLKKNGKFQPLLQKGIENDYAWFSSFDNLIPTIEKGDYLVYTSEKNKPTAFQFVKMKDLGYTTGIKYDISYNEDESKNIYSFPTDFAGYSPFSKVGEIVGSRVSDKTTDIQDINGKKITPLMFTEEGFLKGLTKNALYQFGYYYGTKYNKIDILADTHVYTKGNILISNSFTETKKGYIKIDLPEGATSGVYNLEDSGGGLLRVE